MGAALSPRLLAQRGAVLDVTGSIGGGATTMLLSLLAPLSTQTPVAYVDVRGAVSPVAAAELGCDLDRTMFVRVREPEAWAQAVASLLDGVVAIAAEVPRGVPHAALRTLAGRVRARTRLLVLGTFAGARLPAGLALGRIDVLGCSWEGITDGRGHLRQRRLHVQLQGKLAAGGQVQAVLTPPSLELDVPAIAARRLAVAR